MIVSKCKMCGSTEGRELLNVSECNDTYLDYMEIEYKSRNRFYKECNNCSFVYRSLFLTDDEKEKLMAKGAAVGSRDGLDRVRFDDRRVVGGGVGGRQGGSVVCAPTWMVGPSARGSE